MQLIPTNQFESSRLEIMVNNSRRRTQLCILAICSVAFVVCSWTFFWAGEEKYLFSTTDAEDRSLSNNDTKNKKKSIPSSNDQNNSNNKQNVISSLKRIPTSFSNDVQQQPMGGVKVPDLTFTLIGKPYDQDLVDRTVALIQDEMEEDEVEVDPSVDGTQIDDEEDGDNDDEGSDILPLCNREQIMKGKWLPRVLDKPPYIVSTVHLRCYPHDTYYDKKNGWKTWRWVPTAKDDALCRFDSSFQKTEFCSLLPDGVVSIIGDSLSWEVYRSLVQLNGLQTHQNYQHQSNELRMNIYQSVCNKRTKVLYRRDDKLQNITASIQKDFPIVLLLNRGAHYVPDEFLIPDIQKNIQELKEHWIPKCIEQKIKCHLFWRTSVPGHPFCSIETGKDKKGESTFVTAYTEPNNNLQQMEELISNLSNYNERSINYHWYDYQHQNQLVVTMLQDAFHDLTASTPYFTFEIIDAYYLNVRRPDEHRAHQGDCLHNCYPGKMDIYNVLLLHYLRIQRTEHDIQQLQDIVTKNGLWIVNETTPYRPELLSSGRKTTSESDKKRNQQHS